MKRPPLKKLGGTEAAYAVCESNFLQLSSWRELERRQWVSKNKCDYVNSEETALDFPAVAKNCHAAKYCRSAVIQ